MSITEILMEATSRGGGAGRRMRRRRSRERARIVRDVGMMQITSVINEGNLEGIELQEW